MKKYKLPLLLLRVVGLHFRHVTLLESEVFHEHVDVSGIVLFHDSSLAPSASFSSMLGCSPLSRN